MDFMPTALNRSCTHLGAGPFFTPRISRPAKIGQASLFSGVKSRVMFFGLGNLPATGWTFSVLQRAQSRRRQIARNAPHTGGIAAIGGDGNVDHRIGGQKTLSRQRGGGGRADLGVGGQVR